MKAVYTAHGSATRVDLSVAGSGNVRARGVTSRTAAVSIAGSGDAEITAKDTANVSIVGSGDAEVAGGPQDLFERVVTLAMAQQPPHASPPSPTSVAIHDDGDVARVCVGRGRGGHCGVRALGRRGLRRIRRSHSPGSAPVRSFRWRDDTG